MFVCFVFENFNEYFFFLEQFKVTSKTEAKVEISHITPPRHMHSLTHCQHSLPEWYSCYDHPSDSKDNTPKGQASRHHSAAEANPAL